MLNRTPVLIHLILAVICDGAEQPKDLFHVALDSSPAAQNDSVNS